MRKTLFNYSITFLIIVISTLLFSLIITSLYFNNIIGIKLYQILTNVISGIIFLLSGLFLGMKETNKGLLKGLIFSSLYLSIALLINFAIIKDTLTMQSVLNLVIRFILFPIGSIIGVNLK